MARSLFLAGLLIATFAAEAKAQSQQDFFFLQDRVTRLEQSLGGGASPQSTAGLALRIDALENQVRVLTGQVDEANFRVQRLEEQLRRFQEDTEFRFRELQGGGISAIPDSTPLNPGAVDLSGAGTPPQSLGTLSSNLDGPDPIAELANRPLDLSALSSGGNAASPNNGEQLALAVPQDPRADFELGYSLVITGDYAAAETIFRDFLVDYPGHPLTPDATYWIGESLYARGDFRGAADRFLETYTGYGSSPQAAPSLLKLALSLDALGEPQAACQTLGELREKYSSSDPAVTTRGQQEARRLGC